MRIWFVSELFYPIRVSTGYYITEIAKSLSVSGHDVRAISTMAKYRSSDAGTSSRRECHEGIQIFRVPGGAKPGSGTIARAFRMAVTAIRMFRLMLLLIRSEDQVVAVTNPPLIIPCLFLLKIIKGTRYTVIVHDLFPDNLAALLSARRKSAPFACLRKLYYYFYSKARRVVCIGRDMEKLLRGNLHAGRWSLSTVTNWADDEEVLPIPKGSCALIRDLGLEDKTVLQFAGNLGNAQNIEAILELAGLCDNRSIHFLFIGTGRKAGLLKEFLSSGGRGNVSHIDYMDRGRQREFLNACDIGMVALADGMYGLGVPSKAYNIMATGRPILFIGDEGSEIFEMVRENLIGWAFRSEQLDEIARFLSTLSPGDPEIMRRGANARKLAETVYSKKRVLRLYVETLTS
jgi:glycosyltransferase involved in cell wall biosynthesis